MKSYIISYDLVAPGRDYSNLYEKIKSYSNWARILESVWVIKTDSSSTAIRDNLKAVMDANDKLFVANLSGEAAWKNLSTEVSTWLKDNL